MINVGDKVRLKESVYKLAKTQKVILRARVTFAFSGGTFFGTGCIVECVNGSEYKYTDKSSFKIIEMDRPLEDSDKITFIAEHQLEPINENDDSIIPYGLYTKWNVFQSDLYNKYHKEYKEKYGHYPPV